MLFSTVLAVVGLAASTMADMSVEDLTNAIKHSYVVTLKNDDASFAGSSADKFQRHQQWLNTIINTNNNARFASSAEDSHVINEVTETFEGLNAYVGTFSSDVVAALEGNADVDVEPEQLFTVNHFMPTGKKSETSNAATWGLGRISQREALGYNDSEAIGVSRDFKYTYPVGADGKDVDVYVIDSGIDFANPEFEGRARWGKTTAKFSKDLDIAGHGTHVAGIIGSKSYGVAKKANLIAVKVLLGPGVGPTSWIFAGIDWVVKEHKAKKNRRSVANMSLGGKYSRALNQAVDAAIDAGVVISVAAGNDNKNADHYSPASSKKAITVAASDVEDNLAFFSNWGPSIDIIAPGHRILSTVPKTPRTPTSLAAMSGTSMASPFVTGAVAALYSTLPADTTPAQIKKILLERATQGAISDPKKSPNMLLYVNA